MGGRTPLDEATIRKLLNSEDIQRIQKFENCLQMSSHFRQSFPIGALGAVTAYMVRKFVFPQMPMTYGSQMWSMVFGYLAGILFHKQQVQMKCYREHFPSTPPEQIVETMFLWKYLSTAEKNLLRQKFRSNETDDQLTLGTDEPILDSLDTYSGTEDLTDSFSLADTDLTEQVNAKKEMTYEELRKMNRERKLKQGQGSSSWAQNTQQQRRPVVRPIDEFDNMDDIPK